MAWHMTFLHIPKASLKPKKKETFRRSLIPSKHYSGEQFLVCFSTFNGDVFIHVKITELPLLILKVNCVGGNGLIRGMDAPYNVKI